MIKKVLFMALLAPGLAYGGNRGHPDVGDVGSPHVVRPIARPRRR
jgi:hypothetical protein